MCSADMQKILSSVIEFIVVARMAAVQTSTQRRTGSSRTQTISALPAPNPLQTITPTSTSQPPSTQNISTPTNPPPASVPKQPSSSGTWTVPVTSNVIAYAALLVTLVFGIGAWVGQAYGNMYSKKSYDITLWGLCADHPVSISRWLWKPVDIYLNSCRVFREVTFAAIVFRTDCIERSNETWTLQCLTIQAPSQSTPAH